MYIYKLFVGTYVLTSLLCFTLEMIWPDVRHNEMSRKKILINYDDMLPVVTLNLIIAYPYYYIIEPYVIFPNLAVTGVFGYVLFMYYFQN